MPSTNMLTAQAVPTMAGLLSNLATNSANSGGKNENPTLFTKLAASRIFIFLFITYAQLYINYPVPAHACQLLASICMLNRCMRAQKSYQMSKRTYRKISLKP